MTGHKKPALQDEGPVELTFLFGEPDQTTTFTSLPGTTMTFFTGLPSMNS